MPSRPVALRSLRTARSLATLGLIATATFGLGPEIGPNDRRISAAGGIGDAAYGAFFATAAANSDAGEVLVCWEGEDAVELAIGEREIYCQRLDASTGAEIGDDFRVSTMGGVGDAIYSAATPALAYNAIDRVYLVVWSGSDQGGDLAPGELEIYGQLLAGADGSEIGGDFRVSDMGPDGDLFNLARAPAVAFDSTDGEFLVCWEGVDNSPVSGELEIYCQRLAGATGLEVGSNDSRVSDMGPEGSSFFNAQLPAVAWSSASGTYLVVWRGDDDTPPLIDNEDEIFGQLLAGATGAEVGTNDFRVSDMGPDGNAAYDADHPAVAYAAAEDEFLVCWSGDDDVGGLVEGELEAFCQRLDAATGGEQGDNDLRVSAMGPDGDAAYDAFVPRVAYSPQSSAYLVAWYGDDDAGGLVEGELEVHARYLRAATGAPFGALDLRVSDMGPDGDTFYHALSPVVVATTAGAGEFLAAWHGTDSTGGVAPSEHEIYVQRLLADFLFWDDFERGDTSAWWSPP